MSELLYSEFLFTNYSLRFLKMLRCAGVAKKIKKERKRRPDEIFLAEGWSIEGCVAKVIERIIMDFGLHIKSLVTIKLV